MNIKTVNIFLIVVIIAIGLTSMYCYWFIPVKVDLKEVARLNTSEELPGTWWFSVFSENDRVEEDYNVKLPKNDYTKNYLVISGGREMKQLSFKRISKFESQYKEHPYFGDAILKKQLHPHTIFVYRIDKIRVKYDDLSWPKVKIED
jgi:hypothetical protein